MSRTYKTAVAAAKVYAKVTGEVRGAQGGWIYAIPSWRPLCQGWAAYANRLRARGALLAVEAPSGRITDRRFTLHFPLVVEARP